MGCVKWILQLLAVSAAALKPQNRQSFCDTDAAWIHEWSDEFNGDALDPSFWQVVTSRGGYEGIDLPVAGLNVTACRSAACREENVQVAGGFLRILSERDGQDATRYYSAAVTTKDRVAWSSAQQPFRLCVRAQLPLNSKGVWPAHWMLPQNGYSDRCLDEGEMDITEMVSSDGLAYNTYHWMSSWPGAHCGQFEEFHKSVASSHKVPSYNTEFHEYAVERSSSRITFAIDGHVTGSFSAERNNFVVSETPFFLILNTAIGGGWPGAPSAETQMPVEHLIDWVRVVRKSEASTVANGGFQVSSEIRRHTAL
ncbi:unnamed protein product [Effrenium voratum]|nr:unnamed protein product [Effrenium voratum]